MQDGLNDYSQGLPCYQMSKTKNQSKQEQNLETW